MDRILYMRYLGALSLFGRIVKVDRLPPEDAASVEQIYRDANEVLRKRDSDVRFEKTAGGGYATFDRPSSEAAARFIDKLK